MSRQKYSTVLASLTQSIEIFVLQPGLIKMHKREALVLIIRFFYSHLFLTWLSYAICDHANFFNDLISYYEVGSVSYQNVEADENVPLITDFRILNEIISQLKSFFTNSDLKIFKVFLPKTNK